MRESIVSISLSLGKALLRLYHLIGIEVQKWSNRAELIEGLATPVVESNLSSFYDPSPTSKAKHEILKESGNLPETYGETRLVLLPVHPYLIHAYWEVTPKDLERVKHRLSEVHGTAKPILRFYDITYIEFDGTNAHSSFDVEIDLQAKCWKVHLWSPEKSYIAELGFKGAAGEYFAVIRSNVAHTPRAWPSIRKDRRYMRVGEDRRQVQTVPHDPSPYESGSSTGGVAGAGSIPVGQRAGCEQTQAGALQADKGIEPVKPVRKLMGPEPAARSEKQLDQSEIPRPIGAFETLSDKLERLCGFRSGEGFMSEAHEPKGVDLTELGEQKFTPGLSSRSKGTDSG